MTRPIVTIAIIELAGGDALRRCIAALSMIVQRIPAIELVVVRRRDNASLSEPSTTGVPLTVLYADTIPQKRMTAALASASDIMCFIEDTVIPGEQWIDGVLESFQDPKTGAAWGPVSLSNTLGPRYRALGIMEYGRFAVAAKAGDGRLKTPDLPGAAMAFRRDLLIGAVCEADQGVYEQEAAKSLIAQGYTIRRHPKMAFEYQAEDVHGARLTTRMGHGRLYGATLCAAHKPVQRIIAAGKAIFLPGVLLVRAVKHISDLSDARRAPAELSWILLMGIAWSIGEFMGILRGAGDSAGTWR